VHGAPPPGSCVRGRPHTASAGPVSPHRPPSPHSVASPSCGVECGVRARRRGSAYHLTRFPFPGGGEKKRVATPQDVRGWARPPCRHFKTPISLLRWVCFPNPSPTSSHLHAATTSSSSQKRKSVPGTGWWRVTVPAGGLLGAGGGGTSVGGANTRHGISNTRSSESDCGSDSASASAVAAPAASTCNEIQGFQ
jgi:hypothetical protein